MIGQEMDFVAFEVEIHLRTTCHVVPSTVEVRSGS